MILRVPESFERKMIPAQATMELIASGSFVVACL
jgi:hypothetical protein